MPTGLALHVGLNRVDPSVYGSEYPLLGCHNDAHDMRAITGNLGYRRRLLLDQKATATAVLASLGRAADQLDDGDIFVLTYSGHGSQITDTDGPDDESDGDDETWVLFDRMLVDDELYRAFTRFKAGVRVVVVSDSCHSGTAVRDVVNRNREAFALVRRSGSPLATAMRDLSMGTRAVGLYADARSVVRVNPGPRVVPSWRLDRLGPARRAFYGRIRAAAQEWKEQGLSCSLILLSGCQDNQVSLDGATNGLFTEKLLRVWSGGSFAGGYRDFGSSIVALMPPEQAPNYLTLGVPDPGFEAQRPFTLSVVRSQTRDVDEAAPEEGAGEDETSESDPWVSGDGTPTDDVTPGESASDDTSGWTSEADQPGGIEDVESTEEVPWGEEPASAEVQSGESGESGESGQVEEPESDSWPSEVADGYSGSNGSAPDVVELHPTVTGPASVSASAGPPAFSITGAPYFELEIGNDRALLAKEDATGSPPQAYFATWAAGGRTEHLSGDTYTLDAGAWARLRTNRTLYYRIFATSTPAADGSEPWTASATPEEAATLTISATSPATGPATGPATSPAAAGAGVPAAAGVGYTAKQAAFYDRFLADAKASEGAIGMPTLFTLAQSGVETGWGASAPGNMMFGVKAKPSDPLERKQLLVTHEILSSPNAVFPEIISKTQRPDGKWDYKVKDWFRRYDSPTESFVDHGNFLKSHPKFKAAFAFTDPYAFAKAIAQGGYATAPNYGDVLAGAIRAMEKVQASRATKAMPTTYVRSTPVAVRGGGGMIG